MVTESGCPCLERAVRRGCIRRKPSCGNRVPQRAIVESSRLDFVLHVRLLGSSRVGWLLPAVAWRPCSCFPHAVADVTACWKWPTCRPRRPRCATRLRPVYNRVGNVKNGERVEVLDREKRFARVRTASGIEGWIEQRFLVDQKTFDALQKLTAGQSERSGAGSGSPAQRNQPARHARPRNRTSLPVGFGREGCDPEARHRRKQPGRGALAEAVWRSPARRRRRARCSKTGGWCATIRAAWDGCWRAWWTWMSRSTLRSTPRASASSLSSRLNEVQDSDKGVQKRSRNTSAC